MEYADGKMLAEIIDGVGVITFNNPEKRNAMSSGMWEAMDEIIESFEADPAVRVVVLKGAGDKSFVAGADLSEMDKRLAKTADPAQPPRRNGPGHAKLNNFSKPTIAQVRGFCIGGGLAIALMTDLRIASEDAQFGVPVARLGNAYGEDSVGKLIDLIGPSHTRMMCYTATRVSGAEAARIGLANQVVPNDQLEATVMGIARTIAENAPLSVNASKILITELIKDSAERNRPRYEQAIAACFASADFKEGRAAFLEKRKPRFQGA